MRIDYFAKPFAQAKAFWEVQPDSKEKQIAEIHIRTIEKMYSENALTNNFDKLQLAWSTFLAMTNYEIGWLKHQNDPDKVTIRKARKAGGVATAETNAAEKAKQKIAVFNLFDKLTVPERNRASIISERLGITPRTVRNYIRERKAERR